MTNVVKYDAYLDIFRITSRATTLKEIISSQTLAILPQIAPHACNENDNMSCKDVRQFVEFLQGMAVTFGNVARISERCADTLGHVGKGLISQQILFPYRTYAQMFLPTHLGTNTHGEIHS